MKELKEISIRAQEGGPGLLFPIPFFLPPSLISHTVSVDVKHHAERKKLASELRNCVSVNREVGFGSHIPYPTVPSPVANKPYGFCGRKAP